MYKKFNIKILAALLGVLLIAVIAVYLSDKSKGERSFRAKMVDADTSKISKIVIYPRANKDKAIELKKENEKWEIIEGSKTYQADESAVKGILGSLAELKPEKLAATDKSRWGEFDVSDSAATRVKLYIGKKLATHLYIGRFSYKAPKNQNQYNYYNQQQGTISTYVRLADEKTVYSCEGYIGMLLDRKLDDFRNKSLIRFNKDDLTSLVFSYPADSSFTLNKEGNKWTSGGLICDSLQVVNYLNSLAYMNGSEFSDDLNAAPGQPIFSLTVEGNNLNAPILVKAYAGNTPNQLLLNSSLNEEAYFIDNGASLAQKIFVSKNKFLKQSNNSQ